MPSSAEFWSAVEFLGEAGCPTLTPARVSINYEGTRQPDLVTNGRVPRTDDRGSIVSTTVIVTFGRNAKTFDIDRGGAGEGTRRIHSGDMSSLWPGRSVGIRIATPLVSKGIEGKEGERDTIRYDTMRPFVIFHPNSRCCVTSISSIILLSRNRR